MTNIFNYNETNILDDPGTKLVITCQECNRVEKVMHHSYTSLISIMFAGWADRHYFPPIRPKIFIKSGVAAGP